MKWDQIQDIAAIVTLCAELAGIFALLRITYLWLTFRHTGRKREWIALICIAMLSLVLVYGVDSSLIIYKRWPFR